MSVDEIALERARRTMRTIIAEVQNPRNPRFRMLNESELADLQVLCEPIVAGRAGAPPGFICPA